MPLTTEQEKELKRVALIAAALTDYVRSIEMAQELKDSGAAMPKWVLPPFSEIQVVEWAQMRLSSFCEKHGIREEVVKILQELDMPITAGMA